MKELLKNIIKPKCKVSYSKWGEDVLAVRLLEKMIGGGKRGFYVDVGAHEPINNSLTYKLYKKGWHGITIEPNPRFNTLYKWIRPRDEHINCGIGTEIGEVAYYTFSKDALNTFDKRVAEQTVSLRKMPTQKIKMPMYTLEHILGERKISNVDFLKVDTEGYDLNVLKSNDWNTWKPKLIVVEDHTFIFEKVKENEIVKYLASFGYQLINVVRKNLFFSLLEA